MFHLNSSSHCGSTKWNTNFARTYLQISEEQLEKIKRIPGWSKVEESEKIANKNDKENFEKLSTQQASTSTENLPTIKTSIFAKNDALKIQNYNSDLKLKPKPITFSAEKEAFLKNVSLSPIKKKFKSTYPLQRSTSLPDLHNKLLSANKSSEIYRKRSNSKEKDISSIEIPPLLTRDIFNQTNAVSKDGINDDNLLKINSRKSASCPLEYSNQFSKQKKLKTLDDSILNRKHLKDTVKSVTIPLLANDTGKTTLQQEMSLLGKKLLMLEKRFSPSKERSNQPITANMLNVGNLNCEKNMNSSLTPTPSNQVVTAEPSSDAAEIFDKIQTSSLSKSDESLSKLLNEKHYALKNNFELVQDSSDNVPKTTGCNFESFLSPPVPCGQLAPTDVSTLSQPTSAHQSVELNTPRKSQVASPPVTYEQPLPTKDLSASQPVPSQKFALNELQNTELSCKIMVPEKPSGTFSVFSVNSNEKIPDLASSKESGAKRKRKNRNEKSSKKSDMKKLKRIDIQFSSSQIKNMIAILKIFHTEF